MAKLIKEGKVTREHVNKLRHQLVEALEYIQDNHLAHHPLRPENIIFTENIGNLKLIDVGFDQRNSLTPRDTSEDIANYGRVVKQVLDSVDFDDPALRKVADRCLDPKRRYTTAHQLHLALAQRNTKTIYLWIIAFLTAMVAILIWMSLCPPTPVQP